MLDCFDLVERVWTLPGDARFAVDEAHNVCPICFAAGVSSQLSYPSPRHQSMIWSDKVPPGVVVVEKLIGVPIVLPLDFCVNHAHCSAETACRAGCAKQDGYSWCQLCFSPRVSHFPVYNDNFN